MSRTFDGPDCGSDGCEREVGHIGDHRRVDADRPVFLNSEGEDLFVHAVAQRVEIAPDLTGQFVQPVDALLIVRRWVDAIGCVDMLTKRRIRKAEAITVIDLLIRNAPSPAIECLCGDVFQTTETMAEHLWMAHGHEVPPRPESVRAVAERLGIPPLQVRDYPHRYGPFEDDTETPEDD